MLGFDNALEEQARRLTPTPTQLARIDSGLRDVFHHLQNSRTELGEVLPVAFTQGSVRLRTSITPRANCGFDADVVCVLQETSAWNGDSREPFDAVGRALKAAKPGRLSVIEMKKRCWAVHYDDDFHVDVTPALIPLSGSGKASSASALTVFDNERNTWKSSDPIGFSEWFYKRGSLPPETRKIGPMDPLMDANWRSAFVHSLPLCRAVQLLKRARDVWFGLSDLAPNSILLTTLAGRHYRGETNLEEAVLGIARRTVRDIDQGRLHVVNPVNATENLSENWITRAGGRDAFCDFARALQDRLTTAAATQRDRAGNGLLEVIFGSDGCAARAGRAQ